MDSEHAAQVICYDLLGIGGEVEVGIDRDERRWTLVAFDEKLETERTPLTGNDTWLVYWRWFRVTAASIIGVARASTDANAHFILLGRSSLIEETQSWIGWDEQQLSNKRWLCVNN